MQSRHGVARMAECVGTPEPGKLVMDDLEEKGKRVEPGAASVGDSG